MKSNTWPWRYCPWIVVAGILLWIVGLTLDATNSEARGEFGQRVTTTAMAVGSVGLVLAILAIAVISLHLFSGSVASKREKLRVGLVIVGVFAVTVTVLLVYGTYSAMINSPSYYREHSEKFR